MDPNYHDFNLSQRLPDREVHMVPLSQRQPHRQPRVNPDRCTVSDVKVAPTEVARDSCGFVLRERSWTLRRAECRGRGAGVGAVVLVVLLVREVGRNRIGHGGRSEGDGGLGCAKV